MCALRPARPAAGWRRARLSVHSAATLGALSLAGLTAISLTVVLIAAERPSFITPTSRAGFFPEWMVGPLRGLWPGLTSNAGALEWLVSGLMAAMYVLYVAAYATAPHLRARWTIAALLAIHAIFFLAPPLPYTDVFNYINYGRMGIIHHLNPYMTLPVAEPHTDPSFALSNWHHLRSPYGPLFTLLTYALVPLGVHASFWTLKLLVGVATLGTLVLVWHSARLLGRSQVAAIVFVGCNPIVLIWGLGADHNDALMMFLVMLAVYLGLRDRPAALGAGAGAALTAAVFVKASAAVLLPLFLLAGARRRFLAGGLAAAAGLGAAGVVAFGLQLPDLSTQSGLVTAIGLPNLLGLALGKGGETAGLHTIVNLALVATVVGCTAWIARRPREWLTASAVVLLVLVVSLSWAAPWYILWVLPFAALSAGRRVRAIVVPLGVYFILAFMPAAVPLENAIHFRPTATSLGIRHTRAIDALVS